MPDQASAYQRVEAASAVTISFGGLTAALCVIWPAAAAAGWLEQPHWAELLALFVVGMIFVGLGWGVRRGSRTCTAIAATLAGVIVVCQLYATWKSTSGQSGSLFFLVLAALVLAGNQVAWKDLGRIKEGRPKP